MPESPQSSDTPESYQRALDVAITADDGRRALALLSAMPPGQVGPLLRGLTPGQLAPLWRLLAEENVRAAADLLDHLPDGHIAAMLHLLPSLLGAQLLEPMESDDRIDVLALLDEPTRQGVLQHLPAEVGETWQLGRQYPVESTGAILKSERLAFSEDATVADLVAALKRNEAQIEHYETRYLYLFDQKGRHFGAVPLHRLLLQDAQRPLRDWVDSGVPTVTPALPIAELKGVFDHVRYSVLPVVDDEGRLVGVVDQQDLQEALYEEAEKSSLERGGIFGGEEMRSMPLLTRGLRRLAFLLPSVVLSYAAVSVIALYEPVLEQVVLLAAFLPLVANLSGAVGNQAVAVSIRELAVDRIGSDAVGRVMRQELPIGLLAGLVVGLVLAALSLLRGGDHPELPWVIGGAYALSSVVTVLLGGALPLWLRRLGLDPAMLASPVLTTLSDATAFFLVLFLAQWWLLG
ncbi:magnesium transporter [Ferrimonas balearica]|uniref:magnesium transporter n=1 Tax=Ferrimonas balearica TaxID=44012 RepID=UPI001C9779B4|nr:magnesium transporter [Ferrimonas balearica]MBY5980395.1 magnesium transporter [Ferrimonas balearica]